LLIDFKYKKTKQHNKIKHAVLDQQK